MGSDDESIQRLVFLEFQRSRELLEEKTRSWAVEEGEEGHAQAWGRD